MVGELEPESQASIKSKRYRRLGRFFKEIAFCAAFLTAVLGASYLGRDTVWGNIWVLGGIVMAVVVLVGWLFAYTIWHRTLDEFEQKLQLVALALAGGVVVLITIAWGLVEVLFDGPDLPLFLIGPLYAFLYALIHYIVSARYS